MATVWDKKPRAQYKLEKTLHDLPGLLFRFFFRAQLQFWLRIYLEYNSELEVT